MSGIGNSDYNRVFAGVVMIVVWQAGMLHASSNSDAPTTQSDAVAQDTSQPVQLTPEVIVDIDMNDEVYTRSEPMTEQDVSYMLESLYNHGCRTIMVRVGCLGLLPYHTELSYPIGSFDAEHARRWYTESYTKQGKSPDEIATLVDDYITKRQVFHSKYAQVLEQMNLPAVFITHGHRLGMKVILWIDLFDDEYPGYHSKFLDAHPHCRWTSRDGDYFYGVMSYAYAESRQFRMQMAGELLDLGADGIHCSTSAHARHMYHPQQEDLYGFESPIVQEFRQRHGVNILENDAFDRQAWHDLKGEMMVRLYRELSQLCHSRGKEFWVGLQLGRHTHLSANPYFGDNVVARYTNHWQQMVNEGIADAFVLNDYELASYGKDNAYWQAKTDIVPAEGEDMFDWTARHYGPYCKDKTRLYLFGEWLLGPPSKYDGVLAQWADRLLRNPEFAGIDIHEALNLQKPGGMYALQRLCDRLDGIDVGPWSNLRKWQCDEFPELLDRGRVFTVDGSGSRHILDEEGDYVDTAAESTASSSTTSGNRFYQEVTADGKYGHYIETKPGHWSDRDSTIEFRLKIDNILPGLDRNVGVLVFSQADQRCYGFEWGRTDTSGNDYIVRAAESRKKSTPLKYLNRYITYRMLYYAGSNRAHLYYHDDSLGKWVFLQESTGFSFEIDTGKDRIRFGDWSNTMGCRWSLDHLYWTNDGAFVQDPIF